MDPNAALEQVRALIRQVESQEHRPPNSAEYHKRDAEDLADAFRALDGWLSGGGFKPADWSCSS